MKVNNNPKPIVTVCEDHLIKDPDKVQQVLDRISKIVSASYERRMIEGKL